MCSKLEGLKPSDLLLRMQHVPVAGPCEGNGSVAVVPAALWAEIANDVNSLATRCERAEAALAAIAERHGFHTGRQTGQEFTQEMLTEIDDWVWNQGQRPGC